jgi:outer membrane protein insertion porin family
MSLRNPIGRVFLACALLWAALGRPLPAQELDGATIVSIEIEGLATLTADTVEFYLGLERGARLDWQRLDGAIRELWDRQLIEDISVEATPVEGGAALKISLIERPILVGIEYQGLKRVSRNDISDRIIKDRIRVREGDPLSRGELERLKAAVEEIYREKGYRLAEASYTVEEVSLGDRRVYFSIDEGDKVRIAEIDFEGNTVYGDRRLQLTMKKTKEAGLLSRILKKDVFNVATFEEDLDKVRAIYRKIGYKNVLLGEPQIEIQATRPNAPTLEEQRRRLFITVPVEEGDRWKLGDISIEGNDKYPDELLLLQFQKPRGGWLRSKVIDDGIEAINEIYNNTGHLFAKVAPELRERRDEQVADLVVHVDEGDQYKVGRIEFQGNTKTRDKVIRRNMGVQEGRLLNAGALRNSLLRIRQLEFFKVDEEDPVQFDFEPEEKKVNLEIKGEEGDRTELLFGGGFSELDGLFGQFQFKTRNFLGRGETLAASIQSGRRQDVFDLSYFIPFFLDRPQNVGIQAFQRRLDYDLLSGQRIFQDSTGGTVSYGRNLGLFRNITLSFSSYDTTDRRTFLFGADLLEQEFDRGVNSLRLSYGYDRRDSRLQPTTGMRYTGSVDYAGGVLGGSTWYWRPRATFSLYKPLTQGGFKSVGAINLEASYIKPFGGRELFFLDRFYLGGETSVRGFRYRSIWVRDENDVTQVDESNFPLGGDRSLQVNAEFIVLVGGPFRLIAYLDAGKVWGESQSLDFTGFRTSAGVEMQVNVPLFGAPLRFIWARNLDPLPDDRFDTFQFSVGPSF